MEKQTRELVWNGTKPTPFRWGNGCRKAYKNGISTQYVYRDGTPVKYGIWNSVTKRFVRGIAESSARRAARRAWDVLGDRFRAWRFDVAIIPFGWEEV